MPEDLVVDQTKVVLAMKAIVNAFESNGIDKVTGSIAMQSLVMQLVQEGVDVRLKSSLPQAKDSGQVH